jgi:uncharacterized membrane protein YqaE (UPF0057 family)
MNYVLAIFLPPLAVLLEGKIFQFFLNCILCLLFVFPGVIHALVVVHSGEKERDAQRLLRGLQSQIEEMKR